MTGQGNLPVMLVTGASRGIGAAITRLAAAAGYTVVVNYAASADAAKCVGRRDRKRRHSPCRPMSADESDVLAMFAAIDERCGRLDVLVNNAGIAGSYGTLDTYTAESMERLWAVNLTGPFLCAREAAKRMRDWWRWIDHQHLVEGRRARRDRTSGCTTRHRRVASTR